MFEKEVEIHPPPLATCKGPGRVSFGKSVNHAPADVEPFHQCIQLREVMGHTDVQDLHPVLAGASSSANDDVKLSTGVDAHHTGEL